MKRYFACLFLVLSILISAISINATSENQYVFSYPDQNLEVEFALNSTLTATQKNMIADAIAYGSDIPQTYALCWLVGHKEVVNTVSVIQHKVFTHNPRCVLNLYTVTTCENCDYSDIVLDSTMRLDCCPAE